MQLQFQSNNRDPSESNQRNDLLASHTTTTLLDKSPSPPLTAHKKDALPL